MSEPHVLPFGSFIHCIVDRLSTNKGHNIVIFVEVSHFECTSVTFQIKNGTLVSKKIPFSIPVFFTIEKYYLLRKDGFFSKLLKFVPYIEVSTK